MIVVIAVLAILTALIIPMTTDVPSISRYGYIVGTASVIGVTGYQ